MGIDWHAQYFGPGISCNSVKDARWLTIINVFQLKLTSSRQIPPNYTPLFRIVIVASWKLNMISLMISKLIALSATCERHSPKLNILIMVSFPSS